MMKKQKVQEELNKEDNQNEQGFGKDLE